MPHRMRRWLTLAAWVAAGLLLLSQTDAISAHLAGMLQPGILLPGNPDFFARRLAAPARADRAAAPP